MEGKFPMLIENGRDHIFPQISGGMGTSHGNSGTISKKKKKSKLSFFESKPV